MAPDQQSHILQSEHFEDSHLKDFTTKDDLSYIRLYLLKSQLKGNIKRRINQCEMPLLPNYDWDPHCPPSPLCNCRNHAANRSLKGVHSCAVLPKHTIMAKEWQQNISSKSNFQSWSSFEKIPALISMMYCTEGLDKWPGNTTDLYPLKNLWSVVKICTKAVKLKFVSLLKL